VWYLLCFEHTLVCRRLSMEALPSVFHVLLGRASSSHCTSSRHRVLRLRHECPAGIWPTQLLVQQHCLFSPVRHCSAVSRHVSERCLIFLEHLPHPFDKVQAKKISQPTSHTDFCLFGRLALTMGLTWLTGLIARVVKLTGTFCLHTTSCKNSST